MKHLCLYKRNVFFANTEGRTDSLPQTMILPGRCGEYQWIDVIGYYPFLIIAVITDVGLDNVKIVGNKVVNTADEELIRNGCGSVPVLGMVPYTEHLVEVSRGNTMLDPGKIPELAKITEHIFEGVSANE